MQGMNKNMFQMALVLQASVEYFNIEDWLEIFRIRISPTKKISQGTTGIHTRENYTSWF
jgi:hypothetical protein